MTALFKNEDIKIGLPNIFVKSNLVDMDLILKSRKKVSDYFIGKRKDSLKKAGSNQTIKIQGG